MQKTNNLQEIFLTQLRRERRPVTMFLMNGFQMRGYVTGFDAFSVVLTSDGKQMFVYKHAISTITPERPVPLTESWVRQRRRTRLPAPCKQGGLKSGHSTSPHRGGPMPLPRGTDPAGPRGQGSRAVTRGGVPPGRPEKRTP